MSGIAILGAGAFGTALAVTLAREGKAVALWTRDADQAIDMARTRANPARLPRVSLPSGVRPTSDLAGLDADCILLAVPAQALRSFLAEHGPKLDGRTLVSCGKGIDRETGLRPSQLIARACPGAQVAALTGPSFAEDIAAGLPTALTLAIREDGAALQTRLSTGTLRLYLTHDIVGAELGGALKNVIALSAGITMGAGLGESARAAVVTRGFAEITRFAVSEGAAPETLAGLSGLGDLLLTCTSPKSRNYAAGLAVGEGRRPAEGVTIEGLATAEAVRAMASARGIEMPLSATVAAVTQGRMTVAEAADHLMSRPLRKE
jgi:glycerol-3-phosphate dehydrogenase (NAD(P)+)